MDNTVHVAPPRRKKEKELSEYERLALAGMLIGMASIGELPRGTLKNLSEKFCVAPKTVSRLWRSIPQSRSNGTVVVEEVLSKRQERGSKKKWDREALEMATAHVPLESRMTIRDLAAELDVPKSTLQVIQQKESSLRRKKVYLKPKLSEEHRVARIDYCLAHEDLSAPGFFCDMMDRVHVDEKWFNMMQDGDGRLKS